MYTRYFILASFICLLTSCLSWDCICGLVASNGDGNVKTRISHGILNANIYFLIENGARNEPLWSTWKFIRQKSVESDWFRVKKSQRINVKSRYKMFMPVATFQLVRYMLIVVQFWIWNWVLFQKCFAFVQLLILVFHFLPLKQFKFIFFVLPLRIDKFPHHLWTFNLVYDNNVTDNPEQIHRFERSGFGWTG